MAARRSPPSPEHEVALGWFVEYRPEKYDFRFVVHEGLAFRGEFQYIEQAITFVSQSLGTESH